ncbi:hypothetical protein EJ110_NYTH57204 [Nymphaea thermarum]|nr:hypothetical protein EJ110_NYTH57204 [Nymphaea thermarum]
MKSSPFFSLITKMNGGNYEMWAMQVKRTLIAHDKEHLILEPEPVQKVDKYTTWFKDNSLVMVWIVGTLSQDIANEVLHKESAKDMWDSLAATYSQARNETKIMQLHHDIHQMRQDGRPLHTYYSSLKFMFERLNSYFPACKCEQQKTYRDMLMVGVFLSGLDSVYESAKNQMLTSPSISPIDEAYSRLSRIPIPAVTVPDTTSAMLATRGRGGSFFARGRGGRGRGNTPSRPVCQFCLRIGHTVDKCWQKHGRPAFANQTASTESPEQPKAQHTATSSELRVDDLLSQLRSLIGDRPQHAPDPTTSTITIAASASSSGMYSAYTVCPATDTTDWLIDSGASTHLCQIVPFIKSHRLYGHIDGTTPAPPKYVNREVKKTVVGDKGVGASAGTEISFEYETLPESNPEYEVWLAHDQFLVAYITSTLSEEVLGGIDDDLTALELWSTLATTYSQVSEARFLQLRRQFQDIKRGTRTVLEYLNEIKSVSDQLAAIGHPVSDRDKVQQALSGLGTEFDIFCTALEVLTVLPSFEDLKAKLFQHEASRVQRHNLVSSNSHNVLITGTHALQGNRTRSWTPQAGMGRGILPTPPSMNTTSATPRRIPTCFYCNKKGHVKSECWHNPQNKKSQFRCENRTAAGSAPSSSGLNPTSKVSADVQQLLMTALSKLNLKQNEQGEWYVDSGAAAYVTCDTVSLLFEVLLQTDS